MTKLATQDRQDLSRFHIFSGLPQEVLDSLLSASSVEEVSSGKVLFMQGDIADRFYAILEGWVELSRLTSDGRETVIGVFARGETLAEAAMFDSHVFPVTARLVSKGRLLSVPAKPFLAALRNDFDLTLNLLSAVSRNIYYLVQQLEQVQAKSAPQRLGSFLLRLAPELDAPTTISLPYDKSLIAARLGMKPETFSRALAKLRTLGVQSVGNAVTMREPEALHRFCNGGPSRGSAYFDAA